MSFWKPQYKAINRLIKYHLPENQFKQIHQFVQRAEDRELYRSNPNYLAEKFSWPLKHVLDVFSIAAAEKLWHFNWNSWCTHCGALLQSTTSLGEINSTQACTHCNHANEVSLDQEISIELSLNEQVRNLHPVRRDDAEFRQQIDDRLSRVSALKIINRPLFRQMLGEQTLPPQNALGVQHLAVFFSDLKASTLLYQQIGDVEAYQLVLKHFDAIISAVEAHGGSAIKTIGDGLMGTFFDNQSALQGIISGMHNLEELNRQAGLQGDQRLRLKVGLFAGPCIVVTLNHRLDYFGSTVNIAARLSDLAQGGEIIIGDSVLADKLTNQLAQASGSLEPISTSLRGVLQPIPMHRLKINT